MDQSRTKIPGRIDGVAGCGTQREANTPDECANKYWPQSGGHPARCQPARYESRSHEDKDERANHLAQEIATVTANRRAGGKTGKLLVRIFCRAPMRQIEKPHQEGAQHRAENLRRYVRK